MATDQEWRRALDLAWDCDNLAELVWLLRTATEVTSQQQEWIRFLIHESTFRDRFKKEVLPNRVQVPFTPVVEIAKDERRDLADFLASKSIGRRRKGRKWTGPWRHTPKITIRN